MQTIHLEIEDNQLDIFLIVLNNLKDGLVKKFTINNSLNDDEFRYLKSKQFYKDREYFQKCLSDIESGKTKCLNQKDYDLKMDSFKKDLKLKYENN